MILEQTAVSRPFRLRALNWRPSERVAIGTAAVLAFLLVWQIAGSLHWSGADEIASPLIVAQAFVALLISGDLAQNLAATVSEFVQGFVPAVFAGLAFGCAYALVPRFRYLLEPLFLCLYTAPLIAFIPIIVLWFGVGIESKAVMVFISAFIPIAINTSLGVHQVNESWVRACRAFGATRWQVVTNAILPGAAPEIMSGLRLGVGRGIVGVIAAEMYASMHGLGRLIQIYGNNADTADMLVIVAVISGLGFGTVSLLRWAERRIAPWRAT